VVSLKPRSILQLTVTGFLSVTGLLFVALLITSRQLDGLAEQNITVLDESTDALNLGHNLVELTSALERNARQYRVLEDAGILELYENRKSLLLEAMSELQALPLNETTTTLINDLQILEEQAAGMLGEASDGELEQSYSELLLVADRIVAAITAWSSEQVSLIAEETQSAQQLITIQAFLLVAVAISLAAIFTALITRPLIQVEKAISRLGSGGYQQPIQISGPKDLVDLGKRLDWLRDRLSALEQQRSSFLRHVSHELKTPLAAIRESAALLNDEIVGELSDKQKEMLTIQLNNAERLQNLIDQLLRHHLDSFSVINSAPNSVPLQELLEEVLSAHMMTVRTRQLEIERQLQAITIEANREQLRVAIDNLLGNAIKFSPQGGCIDIKLYQDDDSIALEIADQGPGIKPDQAGKIFEAFYQGDQPDNDFYPGNGLGLAIAREYVELNGGTIELLTTESGASFRIRLPLAGQQDAR
jgi:two-component system sensor histidine kinase GlrK